MEISAELIIIVGLALALFEGAVMGLSTVWLLTAGISLMITGILLKIGAIPHAMELEFVLAIASVLTVALTYLLWRPIKLRQSAVKSSDVYEWVFRLDAPLEQGGYNTQVVKGIEWEIRLADGVGDLAKDTKVQPTEVSVGQMFVGPATTEQPKLP